MKPLLQFVHFVCLMLAMGLWLSWLMALLFAPVPLVAEVFILLLGWIPAYLVTILGEKIQETIAFM